MSSILFSLLTGTVLPFVSGLSIGFTGTIVGVVAMKNRIECHEQGIREMIAEGYTLHLEHDEDNKVIDWSVIKSSNKNSKVIVDFCRIEKYENNSAPKSPKTICETTCTEKWNPI